MALIANEVPRLFAKVSHLVRDPGNIPSIKERQL
jgi:hypothetical protein